MSLSEIPESQDRRISDVLERFRLQLLAEFATKKEVAAVVAAQNRQDLEVVKLQTELSHINQTLTKMTNIVDRVGWLIVTAVAMALLGLVLL